MQERFHATDPDKQAKQLDDFAQQGMEMFVEYMYEHFEEFKLLVNGSYGTKFQNFVEHLVDIETEYTYKFMEATGLHFKGGKPVTKNFMHIMNKALFESFFEVVRHDMSKEEAEEYVKLTGCDSLAFCCGNAHDLPEDHPRKLHTDQIARIHRALPEMPLVLHGTSILAPEFVDRVNKLGGNVNQPYNFTLEEIQESFKNGVCKVNSALDIKLVYTSAVKEFMLENPTQFDPRKYLGHARQAAREYIAWKHRTVFMDDGRY